MHKRLAMLQRWYAFAAARFTDRNTDDELLRHLIDSLCYAPSTLCAATAMSLALVLAVWAMIGSPLCVLFAALNLFVGFQRQSLVNQYKRVRGLPLDRRRLLEFDRRFLLWWTLFSAGIGFENLLLAANARDPSEWTLASGVAIGFTVAFALRSSGRLKIFLAQIAAMCGPMTLAYAILPVKNGLLYAGLLVALFLVAILLGFAAHEKIVDLYRANLKMRRMAMNDALTGLMNRFSFVEALEQEIERCGLGSGEAFSLIVVDLDRFKEINDMLGHNTGDEVIVATAARLRRVVDRDDVVGRLGGDEFIVLSRSGRQEEPRHSLALAERIAAALREPALIEAASLPMSASLGVAHYPDHGVAAQELLKKVEIALYEAKRQGRDRLALFDASMQQRFNEARIMEIEIEAAVARDQFEPWFQPIVNIETDEIVGYEALARWPHPARGLIAPSRFIPCAEQTGAILEIGKRIMAKACAAAATWPNNLFVAVNLSPVQFRQPQMVVAMVREALSGAGLSPARLSLEITESLMMEDTAQTRAAINELDAMGVMVSLDDFGSGFSSLSYLRTYPFAKIKIDKCFIDTIAAGDESPAIVSAVRVLAEKLDMDVVAEGVESLRQHVTLRQLGIAYAQGFFYGEPKPQAATALDPRRLSTAAG